MTLPVQKAAKKKQLASSGKAFFMISDVHTGGACLHGHPSVFTAPGYTPSESHNHNGKAQGRGVQVKSWSISQNAMLHSRLIISSKNVTINVSYFISILEEVTVGDEDTFATP